MPQTKHLIVNTYFKWKFYFFSYSSTFGVIVFGIFCFLVFLAIPNTHEYYFAFFKECTAEKLELTNSMSWWNFNRTPCRHISYSKPEVRDLMLTWMFDTWQCNIANDKKANTFCFFRWLYFVSRQAMSGLMTSFLWPALPCDILRFSWADANNQPQPEWLLV